MDLSILFFALLFLMILLTFTVKGTDYFSPGRLFSLVWVTVLGLSLFKFSRFQFDWSWYSWTVIITSIISFLLGIYVVYVLNFGKKTNSITSIRFNQMHLYEINTYSIFKITIFLFLIYFISYIVIYAVVGYIPAFTPKPNLTRAKWGMFGFGLFIHLTPIIIFLVIVYYLRHRGMNKKIFMTLILLITFLSFFLLYQRFSLVFAFVLALLYFYYGTNKVNFKNILVFVLPVIVIIFGLSTLRESQFYIFILHKLSRMKFPIKYAIFTEPYMYLVMNVENFAYAIEKLKFHTYGFYSFDFLLAITGLKHFLKEYFNISDFPALRSVFYNTYTMFFVYYRDFGLIGSFFFPFTLGFIVSHFYYKMRKYPNFHTISFYGMLVIAIIFSYFIPLFTWLHFVFDLFVVYFISRYIHEKSLVKNLS